MILLPDPLAAMGNLRQWIPVRFIPQPSGKTKKLPLDHRTMEPFVAGSNWQQDPVAWTSYQPGYGFLFTPADNFFFIDLDNCLLSTGHWSPLSTRVCEMFRGAAIEVSQSGRGLHIIGTYIGPAPQHSCKNIPLDMELYTESRFVALTGDRVIGNVTTDCTAALQAVIAEYFPPVTKPTPNSEPSAEYSHLSDDEVINKALSCVSTSSVFNGKATFRDLWERNVDALSRQWPGDDSRPYDSSSADAALAQHLAFWTGKNLERIVDLMRKSALVRDKYDREDYLYRTAARACAVQRQVYSVPAAAGLPGGGAELDYRNPLDAAKKFSETSGRTKRYWQGCLFEYTGSAYQEKTVDDTKAELYQFLENAKVFNKDGKVVSYRPNRSRVGEIVEALHAVVNIPDSFKPPGFITENGDDQQDYLACQNGLLNIATRQLIEPTPDFFTLNSLPYSYNRDAADPHEWLKFLRSVWPDDRQAVETLQEIFGYLLSNDCTQQKIFSLIGPMRSGKGTIGRILTALIGSDNVAAPTLAALAREFGLAGLVGKKVALVSDARLSAKSDQSSIAERLLSISGEDHQGVPRKFLSDYTGPLPVRFVILSNEIPRLADSSGALPSRFILLTMKTSFLGREDHGLTKRLLNELPAILNWSLDGLDRLNKRGFFVQPHSGQEAVQELADLSSPISAFLRNRCAIGPAHSVETKSLFMVWRQWCAEQGRDHPGTLQTFGRDLRAAVPGLSMIQPRVNGRQLRFYQGIGF